MPTPIRILFVAPHKPGRSPSQRFRMEQYFPYLKEQGFEWDYSWYISEHDDRIIYSHRHYVGKLFIGIKASVRRFRDVLNANHYDIIFIQREAFLTGSTFFEKHFSKSRAKLVFDFDDAIWLLDVSEANKKFSWLKNPSKTAQIISISDLVIAGNDFLAHYAAQFNSHVVTIPTVVDTLEFCDPGKKYIHDPPICIGWSGSMTTISHFKTVVPALQKLKAKYGKQIMIKVVGDSAYSDKELEIAGIAWSIGREKIELKEIDVGIMPLPDDEWSKGKCGLKGLLYMSMSIPAVVSPVEVNATIIQDRVNGFLADTDQQWMDKISALVESADTRKRLGEAGRKTVEENYSVLSQRQTFVAALKQLSVQ